MHFEKSLFCDIDLSSDDLQNPTISWPDYSKYLCKVFSSLVNVVVTWEIEIEIDVRLK